MSLRRILLKTLSVTFLLYIGNSCKDSKEGDIDKRENKENSEMELKNDGERQTMPEDATGVGPAAQTGGSTGASNTLKMPVENPETGSKVNLDAMYSELEMTDKQIQQFKSSMGNEQLTTLQNTSGELPGNLYENMESELESILDKKQFQKYQEWQGKR